MGRSMRLYPDAHPERIERRTYAELVKIKTYKTQLAQTFPMGGY